jgi:hypothetical protein
MAVRVPLPNRREMQTLTGLTQAIKYHLNIASNQVISDDSALGYINAGEDLDLTPLKSFFMKRSEFVTVNSKGQFRINDLKFPATEISGVFYQFDDLYQQNEYLQYVDPVTFGKGYGTVYTDALYTVTTASDGTNDQVICTYPAPPSAKIGVEYYCDWPKLGDLTTASKLQQVTLGFTGVATAAGVINFQSQIGSSSTTVVALPVAIGDTPSILQAKLINTPIVPFQALPGNNQSTWSSSVVAGTTNVLLTSPRYIAETATLTATSTATGITVAVSQTQSPFIQTVQSNWLLFNFPYVYYYAALKHAYNGLDDLERYGLVEKEWLKAVQVFQQFTDRAEWAGSNRQSDYNQNVIW